MRLKSDHQQYLHWSTPSSSKIVQEYENRYWQISDLLDLNPKVLELAAVDFKKLSRGRRLGRRATYTAEILLRALIVMKLEGLSLREAEVRFNHSLFIQDFLRLGTRPVMSYSLLCKAFNAIRPKTWKKINETLTQFAFDQGHIDPKALRVDTTVVESNIHYPTDSSLLWDCWRVLYRLLRQLGAIMPGLIESRFHEGKVKKLHLFITRYASSNSKKRKRVVKKYQKKFLAQVERIYQAGQEIRALLIGESESFISSLGQEIQHYLPKVRKVLKFATKAWIKGESVPASERIFSIFEDHTELIKKGKRSKPVEFGHSVLLGQTQEKFITQYQVMRKKIDDSQLSEGILEQHKESFGKYPEVFCADKGFCPKLGERYYELLKKVKTLAVPRRTQDYVEEAMVPWYHFRAGIEGSISVLKRAFGLFRSPYRGFKNFVNNVALGVFCHNLVGLTGPP